MNYTPINLNTQNENNQSLARISSNLGEDLDSENKHLKINNKNYLISFQNPISSHNFNFNLLINNDKNLNSENMIIKGINTSKEVKTTTQLNFSKNYNLYKRNKTNLKNNLIYGKKNVQPSNQLHIQEESQKNKEQIVSYIENTEKERSTSCPKKYTPHFSKVIGNFNDSYNPELDTKIQNKINLQILNSTSNLYWTSNSINQNNSFFQQTNCNPSSNKASNNLTPLKERNIHNKKNALNKLHLYNKPEMINYFKVRKEILEDLSEFENIEEIHGLIVSMYQRNKIIENKSKIDKESIPLSNELVLIRDPIEI